MPSSLGLVQHEKTFLGIDERHITYQILGMVMETQVPPTRVWQKTKLVQIFCGTLPLPCVAKEVVGAKVGSGKRNC